jgi:outer membrane protein assembly factor BamB
MTTEGKNPYFLPRTIWVIVGIVLLLSALLHFFEPTGDGGLENSLKLVLWLLLAIILGFWWAFFGPATSKTRFVSIAAVVGLLVVFFTVYRVDSFSGAMVPEFSFRFTESADRALELTASETTTVTTADLATTTPWDFPQFLGPNRDVSVSAVRLDRDWVASPPELVWRQPIGAGWSSFAVVNGFAVTMEQRGEREMVTCYELDSGELVWTWSIDNRFEDIMAGIGPRATPTIDEGVVYALTNSGLLVALDGRDGGLIWQQDLRAEYSGNPQDDRAALPYGRANSPLILESLVVTPAGGIAERGYTSLVAFDKKTGEKVWEGGDHQISMSSPAAATLAGVEQILTVNENFASGHDAESGAQLWEFPWPGMTSADASVSQAVPISPNRVWLSKGYSIGAALLEISAESGGRFSVSEVWSSARVLRTKFSQVTILDGYAYGLSEGVLECVEVETGERVWKHGRYHHGQILRVHDLLLVMSEEGEMFLIEASPERRDNVLGRFQAIEGKTWNNFALYGHYLVVRNAQEAAVYRLPLVD